MLDVTILEQLTISNNVVWIFCIWKQIYPIKGYSEAKQRSEEQHSMMGLE
jgi:hypothetical protein